MSISMAGAQQGAFNAGAVDASTILADVEALGARIGRVRAAIGRVIFGQDEVVDETLITLLSGGHALLIGVPASARAVWWRRWASCSGLPPSGCSSPLT